jgi:cupin superfamily acireductone dioxygenase involved in methionine salvage
MVHVAERILIKCADPAIRLYIIYLSTVHGFALQVLDEECVMLLEPKKETLDLIQTCIDELQDRNTYQKADELPVAGTSAPKRKKSSNAS